MQPKQPKLEPGFRCPVCGFLALLGAKLERVAGVRVHAHCAPLARFQEWNQR
jgi:hypothetical protein